MVASPDDRLTLRLNDAARVLSISPSLLRRMTKAGTIPVVRMGRTGLRYSRDALQAFIKRAEGEPYVPCPSLRR